MVSRNKQTTIILTGGGTAGHVMPHIAMLDAYKKQQWKVIYVGSKGIEKKLIEDQSIDFYIISTGKLRRYFSFTNFTDIFRIIWGFLQSLFILWKVRPSLVFSKGGYVSVPVVVAARLLKIPVVSHESDLTVGLANKIAKKFTDKFLYSFPETKKFLDDSAIQVDLPIRQELYTGDKKRGLALCGFEVDSNLSTLLVMGGSLGAKRINDTLLEILPELVNSCRVIHITGHGKGIPFEHKNYCSFEYVTEELKDIFACCDCVVSRAGANSIFEFLALSMPMLLIPLEVGSRGDQVKNAGSFVKQGYAIATSEKTLEKEGFLDAIKDLLEKADSIRAKQKDANRGNSIEQILRILKDQIK